MDHRRYALIMSVPAIGVLGPLLVREPDGARPIGGRVPRLLLARLVVGPSVVSIDELADAAWGDDQPASLETTLTSHVSRLRTTLRAVVGYDPISSHPGGYRLTIPAEDVDAGRFEHAVLTARSQPAAAAARLLREALALWRGSAFGDLRYEGFAAGEAARLEELRLVAIEDRVDADLRLGRHRDLVAEMAALVTQHPLRERLTALEMRALHADGRHRDALRAYDRLRSALVEESGLEPGPVITALRDAILAGNHLATPEQATVRYARTTGGAHVGYVQRGEGPPWLLGMGCDAHVSVAHLGDEPVVAAAEVRLAAVAGIVRIDRPGIGLSDPAPGGTAPNLDEWGDAALAVADHAGIGRFTVFGTGWSTPPALALAAARPDRVERVVVFNGFARFVRGDDYPIGIPAELVERFRRAVLDTSQETMPPELDDVVLHAPSLATNQRFRAWWRRAGQQGASPATSHAHFTLLFDADVRHLLPAITQPTLVLQRRENRYVRVDHGRYLAEHIPVATYVELSGADQLLAAGDTTPVLDAIDAFLCPDRH